MASCSTVSASNRSTIRYGVPVTMARVTTDSPPMWAKGRQANQRSCSGITPRRTLVVVADASMAVWVRTTPFGIPVVPLEATTSASPGSVGIPPDMVTTPSAEISRDGRTAWISRVVA